MNLYSRMIEGPAERQLIVLHGLFGSSDNWQTAGKLLSEHFNVHLLDLPNHGRSPRTERYDYDMLAEAVHRYAEENRLDNLWLLGHSMGGKAAMRFAQRYPQSVSALMVADMGVKQYRPHHDFVFNAVNQVDLANVQSRKEVEDIIAREISDWGIQQFILKGLTRSPEGLYVWRTNFGALERNMHEILAAIPLEKVQVPTLFMAGGKSDYIRPEDHSDIGLIFPQSRIITIPDAGHWIHAEKPEEVARAAAEFARQAKSGI
jgi:esterase